jgi:excisionase family DNA binding protein
MEQIENLMTPQEVAAVIRLKKSTVYRLLATGKLPCISVTDSKERRSFRVRPRDLEEWLRMKEQG